MTSSSKLRELALTGFAIARDSVPLGFDIEKIRRTLDKLPNKISDELADLFGNDWPSDFFLGAINIIGPDRINTEHDELHPGMNSTRHGFLCIGSNGAGAMYAYSTSDERIYLLDHENFHDTELRDDDFKPLEYTSENIKSVAWQSWDSLEELFDWAIIELHEFQQRQSEDE